MRKTEFGTVRIKGSSGRTYTFQAYPLGVEFDEIGAVYFITGRTLTTDGRISHSRIYCGQTADLSKRRHSNQQERTFKACNANCICILPVEEETSRLAIEQDIHRNYKLLCNL